MATVHHAIPVGDKRNYILKDGVLQNGYSLTWLKSTYVGGNVVYDSTKKALKLTPNTSTTSQSICQFDVNVTDFSTISATFENNKVGFAGLGITPVTNPTSSYVDISSLSGIKNFTLCPRYSNSAEMDSIGYLKSIWLE